MKQYIALARVSSREQEREGFSLAVQEDALRKYAESTGGEIIRMICIAETASKSDERKSFRELIVYAKSTLRSLTGCCSIKWIERPATSLIMSSLSG